ncbi:alkaline phosphatase family protein, partial [bacterium]
SVYCVEDDATVVPGRRNGASPKNLEASTLGEWLHAADPRSRTVAVSGKDRAAITMAGHDATATFWWEDQFGYSTYGATREDAQRRLAPVAAFNEAALDARWKRAAPRWRIADPECRALEGARDYGGRKIDHRIPTPLARSDAGPPRTDPAFNEWLHASPAFDALTLEVAEHLLEEFRLGKGEATDLLAISLSATDYVGHKFGNQGPEMCDQLAHLDRAIGDFLGVLKRWGVPYALVLSADHGGLEPAENVAQHGFPARRVSYSLIVDSVNALLKSRLGYADDVFLGDEANLVVRPGVAKDVGERAMRDALTLLRDPDPALPWAGLVVDAFPRSEVLGLVVPKGKPPDELTLRERFAESAHRDRSPDLFVAVAPYTSLGLPAAPRFYVAGHGSPWDYDRRVPMLFYRPGGAAYEQYLAVETVDIAPTLAALLGVAVPAEIDGRCLPLDPHTAFPCADTRSAPAH